jgi:tripartite-type tricarboxylate transporter receptor subunit TctC
LLPDVPPVNDTVPGYEVSGWAGVGVPRGTPVEVIDRLNNEINAILADPKVKARLAELGSTPLRFTPNELGTFMAAETVKWRKVVKLSSAKPE